MATEGQSILCGCVSTSGALLGSGADLFFGGFSVADGSMPGPSTAPVLEAAPVIPIARRRQNTIAETRLEESQGEA